MPRPSRAEILEPTRRREATAPKVAPAPWREARATLPLSIFLDFAEADREGELSLARPGRFL